MVGGSVRRVIYGLLRMDQLPGIAYIGLTNTEDDMTNDAPKKFTARKQAIVNNFDACWSGCWAVSGDFIGGRNIMPLIPRYTAQKAAHDLNRCETYEEQRELMAKIRREMREQFGEDIRCYVDYPADVRKAQFIAPAA